MGVPAIFLDLDHTLIHSVSIHDEMTFEDWQADYIEYRSARIYDGEYTTFMRAIAPEIVEFCREKVGKENLYILTDSVQKYAREICAEFEFGFEESHILARQQIKKMVWQRGENINAPWNVAQSILVDDMRWVNQASRERNRNKIVALGGLLENNYIQISPFNVFAMRNGERLVLENLKENICKLIG